MLLWDLSCHLLVLISHPVQEIRKLARELKAKDALISHLQTVSYTCGHLRPPAYTIYMYQNLGGLRTELRCSICEDTLSSPHR